MRTFLVLAALGAALVPVGAAGSGPFLLSDLSYGFTLIYTDGSTVEHRPVYGGVIENEGEPTTLYLKVTGRPAAGVPLSGTSAQTVPIEVPTGTSAFSFDGANPAYPHVCAVLVASASNTAPAVSNEVCTDLQNVGVFIL